MDKFAEILGDRGTPEQCNLLYHFFIYFSFSLHLLLIETIVTIINVFPEDNSIAHYYESRNDLVNAGSFYAHCRQYQYALKLFIQAGEPAIEVHYYYFIIPFIIPFIYLIVFVFLCLLLCFNFVLLLK